MKSTYRIEDTPYWYNTMIWGLNYNVEVKASYIRYYFVHRMLFSSELNGYIPFYYESKQVGDKCRIPLVVIRDNSNVFSTEELIINAINKENYKTKQSIYI